MGYIQVLPKVINPKEPFGVLPRSRSVCSRRPAWYALHAQFETPSGSQIIGTDGSQYIFQAAVGKLLDGYYPLSEGFSNSL
jgi:hypothetical protein